ncbi:MAG: hypothetical protein OIF58_15690 [Cohaesibacter sp.]|nr:hypothetical protein [Cohaesibacter sp.]
MNDMMFSAIYAISAVICFTLALMAYNEWLLPNWKPMSSFYASTGSYPVIRAIIVCAVLSAAGTLFAAKAFDANAVFAFTWLASATMVSHIFIAQSYQQKAVSVEIYVLAAVIVVLVFLFGIQMGRLPSKNQEKVNASAEKAITLQATSE